MSFLKNYYLKHKKLVNNFIWRSFQLFGKQTVTFLIFLMGAKLLSTVEFGVYNYALAVIVFLVMFGDFGISTATSKFVSEYSVKDKEKLKSILFNSGLLIFIATILLTLTTLLLGKYFLKDKYEYVLCILPLVFLSPMVSLYDGVYRGLNRFKELAIVSLLTGIIALPISYFLVKNFGLQGALFSQSAYYFILLIGLFIGYRDFHFKIDLDVAKEIAKYSLLVGLADLGIYLYIQFDILVLGHYGYLQEIAYLSIANKIFMFMVLPFSIGSQVLAPTVTSYFTKLEFSQIIKKLKKYFILTVISSTIIAFSVLLSIHFIVLHYFSQYDTPIFYTFFFSLLLILPARAYGTILANSFIVSTGQAKIMTYNNVIFGIANAILDVIFIIKFGAIGVIISTLILGYISVAIAHFRFRKIINNLIK